MRKSIILFLLFVNTPLLANTNSVVWKGEYYAAIPIHNKVSKQYCESHCPGTFTHVVNEALKHPVYTDKGIKLSQARFAVDKIDGLYLIHGSFLASGALNNNKHWKERIHYFLFKKNEYGITKGIWYTDYCKGFYRGERIS